MNSSCTQTNLVLDGFFALLACGKCKQTPERPIRFVTCGHFFCDSCAENDTVCRQCDTPVEPYEKRPHHTVAQLINYCKTIKEMISDLDVGDLWPLANAIHRFTAEQSEIAQETELRFDGIADSAESDEKSNESNLEPETVGYVESSQTQRHTDNALRPENASSVRLEQISQRRKESDLQPENASSVHFGEISQRCKESNLWPENASFVHSTQFLDRPKEADGESETPGYIDPTQISPICKEVDSEPETPGYRDPTQAIWQLEESNFDPETAGYRYPTQMSQRKNERYLDDETAGYADPTPDNRRRGESDEEPNTAPGTEPVSLTDWQDDMEFEIEDKDLFSPIPESNGNDVLAPETFEMEVSTCEGDAIPETLEADKDTQDDRNTLTIPNATDLSRETEELIDGSLTKERMKTLQRKTYPTSDYDTVDIAAESAGKASPRLHRRLTDSALDGRNRISTDDFNTLSVPDVRELFVEDLRENEKAPVQQLGRVTSLALNKRQNRIAVNDRNALSSFVETADREDEPVKERTRVSTTADRRNSIANNDRDTLRVAAMRDSEMEKEAPPKQLRRIRDLRLDRQNKTPMNPRETLNVGKSRDFQKETDVLFETERIPRVGTENTVTQDHTRIPMVDDDAMSIDIVQDTALETVETVEKGQPRLLGRMSNALFARPNGTAINDRDTISIADMQGTSMKAVETDKETPVKQLGRLSDWEVDRQKRTSNSRDAIQTRFAYNDAEKKKEAPPKQLRRIRDLRLDRQNKNPNNARVRLDIGNTGDSTPETEEMAEARPVNDFGRIKDLAINRIYKDSLSDRDTLDFANGGHLAETADFETVSIQQLNEGISPTKHQSKIPTADYDTLRIANTKDSPIKIAEDPERAPPRHLRRLTDWPLNRQKSDSINDSDTIGVANVGDLGTEFEKIHETKPLRQLRRIQNSQPGHRTIVPSDLRELDITNIHHFDREKPLNGPPINDSDTVDVANVGVLLTESEKMLEIRPLRQLRRIQNSQPGHRTIVPSDLRELDITNIHHFDREKPLNGPPINDSDTVDVANVGVLLTESEKMLEIRPLRQLRRIQNSQPGHRTIVPSDLRELDITNIHHFDREKPLNGPPINDSDTVDVANVGVLLTESEKMLEIRPLRQLRRLQNSKPGHHSIIPSSLHGVDITNIEDFAKEQAALTENTPLRQGNLSMKRPSKIPTNDHHHLPIVTAGAPATEAVGQTPLKQLRSVENLETEGQNKTPAKKAKAKIVELKPRRRMIDKSSTVPKAIPKNVNKRNAKGETLLHTACVKGQGDYVKALLETGANPNTKDNASWTPLQEVVKLGRREICEMLLQFGASPNTPGIENRTALHDASQNDKLKEATLLLRFNASRDVYDKYGKRPIDYAVSDEMRALLAKNNAVEKAAGEAVCLNTTFDQSILTPNSKVVVLPSNLSGRNKKALSYIASKLKVAVATSFRPGVTHIVVEANERNTTDLSYYVMLAILQGIWILNSQWIAISVDLHDISEIDLELFEVHGAPNPGTPECSRMNEEKQNPRLFNNCFFYFTIGARGTWYYGKLEFTKASLTALVLAGQGEVLSRKPDPEDVKDNKIIPFHVAQRLDHPLHRCSHYIIYMPGKDEPRIKYNMPHIKTLPLAWLLECIEKFALVDPILIGIS